MKQTIPLLAVLLLASLTALHAADGSKISVDGLKCEYRENPLGIDELTPRLSWRLVSPERGETQSGYRIVVASSPKLLEQGTFDLWDSQKIISGQSLHIPYAGKPLEARRQCFWKVKAWDQEGRESPWSPVAMWEIGLPEAADWQDASWIRLGKDTRESPLRKRDYQAEHDPKPRVVEPFPSSLLRRDFMVKPNLVRARAYVSGLGYSELSLNGRRVGDAVLDPGQSTYDKRAFYVTHDITRDLKPGENTVGVMLGNGFFGQNIAFGVPALALGAPALRAKIVLDYADGTQQVLVTDESWKAGTGAVQFDNVYAGESNDARLEPKGWSKPGFANESWPPAVKAGAFTTTMQAQMIPPIRCVRTLKPQRVFPGLDGKWIFDMGENIAGWARLKIDAPAGTEITLTYAELLTPDGNALDCASTGKFATGFDQTDIYVCKGGGVETWQPRFTYHGFRYIEVAGLPSKPGPNFLEGVQVRTDAPRQGSFTCSDDVLNTIYATSLRTIEDNMHSVMEDCPTREKCGWLGDAHASGETTIFNFDMAQFWTKFVDDIDTVLGRGSVTYWGQKATPGIPCNIAVGRRLCQEARPDWGSAYVMVPWYLYLYYGDTRVFERHYDHLKDWIDYVAGLREGGIVVRGYGDWCPPGGNQNMECPPNLTSTAFFYGTLRMMEKFAQQLGKKEDETRFAALADETKVAFNKNFFSESTGGYGSQTGDAVALRFGLSPDKRAADVAKSMAGEITERHKGHAFVGIHGGRPLYTQLCENGYEQVAIDALKQETWPGHAYTLKQGFTTWPEQMDEIKPGEPMSNRSNNHPMQSGFAAWFHESLGGIRPAAPGFSKIELKPHGYNQLSHVEATHESPYGSIKSNWRSDNKVFTWTISIPPNTTARVYVPTQDEKAVTENGHPADKATGVRFVGSEPGRAIYDIGSGDYSFSSSL